MKALVCLLSLFVTSVAFSKAQIIFPLGKKAAQSYLDQVKDLDSISLGFDPTKARPKDENKEGSSMIVSGGQSIWVYDVDINNDGENEFLAIYVFGGSLNTSGLLSVVKKGKVLDYAKIISQNLWSDPSGDLSKFHLWMAAPAVIKREGKVYLRFFDRRPKPLFTEYLWEKNSFKKVRELAKNLY